MEEKEYDNFVHNLTVNLEKAVHGREIFDIVILCIGTDRVTGDSFGPLVGHKLEEMYKDSEKVHVIGTLSKPVVANNINTIIREINYKFKYPFIIAIDSAVANKSNIGKIVVSNKSMNLGRGLNKRIISIGNMSIKGIVSKDLGSAKNNFILLQNIPLNLVMNMAETVATGIYNVINV